MRKRKGVRLNHLPKRNQEAQALFEEATNLAGIMDMLENEEDWTGENNVDKVVTKIEEIAKLCVKARVMDANDLHDQR